ncbi:hypothetical protein [Bradyrhizobium sp. S3.2.12]|uniref:hypothetical protein n=1 Tax=Bradyrhizobium sp. S3.2.12 TaxID=3156387 RepID=UPI003398F45D
MPGAISDAEQTKARIDELLKSEGLDSIVGPIDQFRPNWTLGDKGREALARYDQLKGAAFLQAYGLLRGGGAITDIEGKKAEQAMARLDRAQSEPEFRTALKDFRDAIGTGVSKLKQEGWRQRSGRTGGARRATSGQCSFSRCARPNFGAVGRKNNRRQDLRQDRRSMV